MTMAKIQREFQILVEEIDAFDGDPAGYVATNDELGLVVEADSLDLLKQRVCELAPELFKLNILPSLRNAAAEVPPAYIIKHHLRAACGEQVLSGT